MLPSLSGFEVLRRLRHSLSVPVIMLTAHGADVDRIVGLELGADDYLAKPFNPRELVARVRAVLRRFSPRDADAPANPVSVGPMRLDPAVFEVTLSGRARAAHGHGIQAARSADACRRTSAVARVSD